MKAPNVGSLRPGELFHERYRVLRCIAAGGMGAVYEVRDERTDGHRALKVMLPTFLQDADMRGRFEREARVTAKIESDHIVQVSDAAIDPETGTPFLVMDLLRGEDLRALLKTQRALPAAEVLTYLGQAALALDKTHAAGVVHRDLKPDNLFVTRRDDGTPCVKILDFGIAKVVAQSQSTRGTQIVGTPSYMSPEQIRGVGTIGPRSDIYALGHIAYTLLVGEAYWKEESRASESMFPLLERMLAGAVEPPCERARRRRAVTLPAGFDAWFARATALLPEERFERATVAVGALADVLAGDAPKPSPALRAIAPRLEGAEPTTIRRAPGGAPAAPSALEQTSTTTGALSSDARAARGPRSRAPIVVVAAGLVVLVGLGVRLTRSDRGDAARAAASATMSTAASSNASATTIPTASSDAPPAEVSPSVSAAAAPEVTAAPAVPVVTATASVSNVPATPSRPVAVQKTAPPPEPLPPKPPPAASEKSKWTGIN